MDINHKVKTLPNVLRVKKTKIMVNLIFSSMWWKYIHIGKLFNDVDAVEEAQR